MGNTLKTGYLQNLIAYDGSGNITLPGTLTISTNKLVATQEYVGTQLAALVNSAPTTLDTLNELAAALGNDPNFATTVAASIGGKVPTTRTLTINGTAYDLSADRSWTIVGGVSSFNTRTGAITLTDTDVTGALGYTPVTNARTLTINGTTYDLSANRSWTIGATSSARNIQTITADGTTATYTVTNGYVVGLVDVYRNGVKLGAADITATNGTTVTLGVTPASGDIIEIVNYVTALTQNNALRTINTFNVSSATNTFTVSYTQGLLDVYYNGSKLTAAEYTATNGTSVVLSTNAAVGSVVEIITYNYSVSGFSGIGGGGTTNYLPKFTGTSAIGNSVISENSNEISINVAFPTLIFNGSRDYALQSNDTSGSFRFLDNTAGAERMVITSAGNIGIGTSSPQMPLSVQANTGNGAIRLIGTSNASSNNAGIYWYDSNDSTFNGYLGNFSSSFDIYNQRSTPMAFYTAGTERMRISSDGSIGFNISTLGSRSFSFQGISGRPLVIEAIENAGVHSIMMRPNNSGYNLISSNYLSGGTYLPLSLSGRENTSDFVLTNTGLVLIGTTSSPSAYGKVSIRGTNQGLTIQDAVSNGYRAIYFQSGNLYFYNGTNEGYLSSGGTWVNASDITLKKDVKEIEYGLKEVMELKPKWYRMIEDDLEQIGFIAQDVEEVLPELVSTSEKGMKGLSYGQLTAVLVKAIQDLKSEIEELKAQINK